MICLSIFFGNMFHQILEPQSGRFDFIGKPAVVPFQTRNPGAKRLVFVAQMRTEFSELPNPLFKRCKFRVHPHNIV